MSMRSLPETSAEVVLPSPTRVVEMKKKKKSSSGSQNIQYPFWFGGSASCMAACVTHPLDLVKVRLQTRTADAPKSMTQTVAKILRTEGVLGFYSGISASLLRQLTYATVRFAIYEEMKQRLGKSSSSNYGDGATVLQLIAMASVSGFVGGVAGNFADVLNVRMQHDAALPLHEQRRYKHALDGMVRMAREEGLGGWFRGWLPNSGRAAVQTASQLACYDIAKRLLLEYTPMRDDALPVQLSASFLAGLTAATVTNPIDVVKTRMMSSSSSTQKQNNIRQLLKTLFRTEGVAWMLKGWVPSFLHQGPHTICIFFFLEVHRKVYRELRGLEGSQCIR